ncbi:MAG: amino acid adenylation domain-containing protein, partial [Deltaproteobacteria bacterium]|nr:amino acid adenylation domain-containing protein [Deltaproteobacteria bacterium]
TVGLSENQGRLEGAIEYATDLFDRETIERMAGHYQKLLDAIAKNPDENIGALEMLGEAERQKLLVEWNATARDYPVEQCVHELFATQAMRTPEAAAVVDERGTLSYRELDERSNKLGRYLIERGVAPKTLVGLCLERSRESVIAALAILKAGGAYVPLDASYPRARLEYMLDDARLHSVISTTRIVTELGLGASALKIDEAWPDIDRQPATNPGKRASSGDLAYVIYTSGSTGQPKGVEIEHRALMNLVRWHQQTYAIDADTRMTMVASLGFDASVWETWPYLTCGAALYVVSDELRADPSRFVHWLCEHSLTMTFLPTPIAEVVLREPWQRPTALKVMLVGGDRLNAIARRDLRFDVVNHYGPTENTVVATYGRVKLGDERPPSIGEPIGNVLVDIVDRHFGLAPIGVFGELCIGGASLARGYLKRPELTAEKFVANPLRSGQRFYRSGDLARRLRNGDIEYLRRNDSQVKVRGFRIELGEIEAALRKRVKEAVVVVHGEGSGKQLVGYYVGEATPQALRETLKQTLPEYMVPAILMPLQALPLTPNGKVDRKALPAPEATSGGEAPRTELEKRIAAVWCKVLKRESVGASVSFFDVGGHSLLLLALHSELEALLEKKISVVSLFQNTTVEAQAAFFLGGKGRGEKSEEQATPRRFGARKTSNGQIAIVGMALRVPGAKTVAEFWKNLVEGKVPLSRLDDATLRAAGASDALLRDERLIRTFGCVDDLDKFDAALFGMAPSEAEITDPQQRLLLQCVWEALEDSGYIDERQSGRIGVYASSGRSQYWQGRLQHPKFSSMAALSGNGVDFVATKLAYRFNMTGPALVVQTACSSGLVTVNLGCEALLDQHCDLAIAGAATLQVEPAGALYEPEGIQSPDGLCRAFDAKANGTGASSGVAVVVLKRLEDALRDDDPIHAVIDACAINNDGHRKDG